MYIYSTHTQPNTHTHTHIHTRTRTHSHTHTHTYRTEVSFDEYKAKELHEVPFKDGCHEYKDRVVRMIFSGKTK